MGGLRSQYHHVVDVLPTFLDGAGVVAPATYRGCAAAADPRHQHGLHVRRARRADAQGDAAFRDRRRPRDLASRLEGGGAPPRKGDDFAGDQWALYHLEQDFSECRDLSKAHPEKLRELIDLWWAEAKSLNALPLDDKWAARSNVNRWRTAAQVLHLLSRTGCDRPKSMTPDVYRRSYSITADVEIPRDGAQGVLLAFGTSLAGYVFYVRDDTLFTSTSSPAARNMSCRPSPGYRAGRHALRYEFHERSRRSRTRQPVHRQCSQRHGRHPKDLACARDTRRLTCGRIGPCGQRRLSMSVQLYRHHSFDRV